MTYQELVVTIKKLTPEQRLSLMEELAQSLRGDIAWRGERQSSLERVRGMLKGQETPSTDEQLQKNYTDYLIKKYA
jgi:hypothetical protein